MAICPYVSYAPFVTYSRGETDNIIMFAQFEEGGVLSRTHNVLSETRDNTETGNKYDDDLTMTPLISEEEMNANSSGNESDAEPMSTEMLEDICDSIQCHLSVNRR